MQIIYVLQCVHVCVRYLYCISVTDLACYNYEQINIRVYLHTGRVCISLFLYREMGGKFISVYC